MANDIIPLISSLDEIDELRPVEPPQAPKPSQSVFGTDMMSPEEALRRVSAPEVPKGVGDPTGEIAPTWSGALRGVLLAQAIGTTPRAASEATRGVIDFQPPQPRESSGALPDISSLVFAPDAIMPMDSTPEEDVSEVKKTLLGPEAVDAVPPAVQALHDIMAPLPEAFRRTAATFLSGVVQSLAGVPKSAGLVDYAARSALHGFRYPYSPDEMAMYRVAQEAEGVLSPRQEEQYKGVPGGVIRGLGQVYGYSVLAMMNPLLAASSILSSGPAEHMENAQQAGASATQKTIEATSGMVSSASELIPLELGEKAWKATSGLPLHTRALVTAFAMAAPDALQEGWQTWWQNFSKKYFSKYDEDASLLKGVTDSMKVGGAVGFLAGGGRVALGMNPNIISDIRLDRMRRDFVKAFERLPQEQQDAILQQIQAIVDEHNGTRDFVDVLDEVEAGTEAPDPQNPAARVEVTERTAIQIPGTDPDRIYYLDNTGRIDNLERGGEDSVLPYAFKPQNEEVRVTAQMLADALYEAKRGLAQSNTESDNRKVQALGEYVEAFAALNSRGTPPSMEVVQKDLDNLLLFVRTERPSGVASYVGVLEARLTPNGLVAEPYEGKPKRLSATTRTGNRLAAEVRQDTVRRDTLEAMLRRNDVRKADRTVVEKLLKADPERQTFDRWELIGKIKSELPTVNSQILNYYQMRLRPDLYEESYVSYGNEVNVTGVDLADFRLHLLTSPGYSPVQNGVRYAERADPHFHKNNVAHGRFYDDGVTRRYVELQLGKPPIDPTNLAYELLSLEYEYGEKPDISEVTSSGFAQDASFYDNLERRQQLKTNLVDSGKYTPESFDAEVKRLSERLIPDSYRKLDEAAARLIIQDAIRRAKEEGYTRVVFPTMGSMALFERWNAKVIKSPEEVMSFERDFAEKLLRDNPQVLFPEHADKKVVGAVIAYGNSFEKILQKEFGAKRVMEPSKMPDGTVALPVMEVKTADVKTGGSVEFFSGIPVGPMLSQFVKWLGLSRRTVMQAQGNVDNFNRWMDQTVTMYELLRRNEHIPELVAYVRAAEQWNRTRTEWINRNDSRLAEWNEKDGFTAEFAGFLFARQKESLNLGRKLSPQETAALAQSFGLGAEHLSLVSGIDSDFTDALDEIRSVLLDRARKTYATNPVQYGLAMADINARIAALQKVDYFPLSRFGDYRVRGIATQTFTHGGETFGPGDTVMSEYFENAEDMLAAEQEYQKVFAGKVDVRGMRIPESLGDFVGLPPVMMDLIKQDLSLTADQQKALEDLTFRYAPGQSFVKNLMTRRGVNGFSEDASRAYASYFLKFGGYLARAKYGQEMTEHLMDLKNSIEGLPTAEQRLVRERIYNWMKDHREYVLNPKNEAAGLKAAVFLWYMAFVPKSAVINLTQVGLQTFPVLAAEYGDAKALAAIAQGYALSVEHLRTGTTGSPRLDAVLEGLKDENKLDQSLATQAAAVADGRWMSSLPGKNSGDNAVRLGQTVSYYGTYLFQLAESVNRRVAAIAAWELEMKKSGDAARAYDKAKRTIVDTQFDTSRLNRPRYMRGKKSIFTVLLPYMHHSLTNLMGARGAGATIRMWLILTAAAGLEGLPGYDWFTALVDFARNKLKLFGPGSTRAEVHKWIRDEVGAHMNLIHEHPDLVMHGASRFGFGVPWLLQRAGVASPVVDLSGSLSMGNFPPGSEALTAKDFNDFVTKLSQSAAGAGFAIPMAAVNALMSDDPSLVRRVESASPTLVRNALRTVRQVETGQETDRAGNVIMGVSPEDRIRQAEAFAGLLGFGNQRLNERRDVTYLAKEHMQYLGTRRAMLMRDFFRAPTEVERKKVLSDIDGFNRLMAKRKYGTLMIRSSDLRSTMRDRYRTKARAEAGLPSSVQGVPVYQDILGPEALPQGVVHEERVGR